jgi:hypothetical protein
VYWVEADNDQAAVHAQADRQEIRLAAARARRVRILLNDALVDLDRPVEVAINGKKVFAGPVARTLKAALETAAGDAGFAAAASLEFDVPLDAAAREEAHRWTATLAPTVRESERPWWEHYARLTLEERRHRPKLEGEKLRADEVLPIGLPDGLTGVRLTRVDPDAPEASAGLRAGDILTGFDGEVFFRDGLGISLLEETFLRRPEPPSSYQVSLLRDGAPLRLTVSLR